MAKFDLETVVQVLSAAAGVLVLLAALARVVAKFAKLTPTPKDDQIAEATAEALEGAAEELKGVNKR